MLNGSKRRLCSLAPVALVLGVVLLLPLPAFSHEPKVSPGSKVIEELKQPEIRWKIPEMGKEVKKVSLPNGLTLYLMEDHEIPLIHIKALVRAGDIYVPQEKNGLAEIFSYVLRTGGTRSMSGEEIDRQLEYLGASMGTFLNLEAGGASLKLLSKDLSTGLAIFSEMLMQPNFDEKEVELAKEQLKEALHRRNDQPSSILVREFYHLLYGSHPYGRVLDWKTIAGIERQDLLDFHKKYFVPNNTTLGIVGDFSQDEMVDTIASYFASWQPREVSYPQSPQVSLQFKPQTVLFHKEINQSYLRMGHFGIQRHNPDAFAIELMNFILGGDDLISRMGEKIRSEKGLAYSIKSSFNTDSRDFGTFNVTSQTGSKSTFQTIEAVQEELDKIRRSLISDRELSSAKEAYINQFVFRFTSPQAVVSQLMVLEYEGYPNDYLRTYVDKIRAVTREDILQAAKKYLKPDKMLLVIVGNKEDLADQLKQMGPVAVKEPAGTMVN